MATYYCLVMEVHGEMEAVREFSAIEWRAEAKKESAGSLPKYPDFEWQNWREGLDRTTINGVAIFAWGSKRPYLFLESLAKGWPTLTLVVSVCAENDDIIGTVAFRGEQWWSSFQESPGEIVPECFCVPLDQFLAGRIRDQVTQAIAYVHYRAVMKGLGIKTLQMAMPEGSS